jgi:hypothetical protein
MTIPNYTYEDAVQMLVDEYNTTNLSANKLALIQDLHVLRVGNPDYETLLQLRARETDNTVLVALEAEIYLFVELLTDTQKTVFDYVKSGYIENNPGYSGNTFVSYVGIYYDSNGDITNVNS